MNLRLKVLMAVTLLVVSPSLSLAASWYDGTWEFRLKAAKTSCSDVTVGSSRTVVMALKQSGRVIAGTPVITGVNQPYTGYTFTNGFTAALESSCTVTLEPVCSSGSESFTFKKVLLGLLRRGTVTWVSIARSDKNELTCVTYYTGSAARKKRASS